MSSRPRSSRLLPVALLLLSGAAWGQSSATSVDGTWQADVEQNQRRDADAQAQARRDTPASAAPPAEGRRGPPPDGGRGGRGGGMGGSGMGGGMGGPSGDGPGGGGPGGSGGPGGARGGPRGPGGPNGPEGIGSFGGPGGADSAPQARLLRPEFEFAAPLARSLMIQRTRSTAIFANHDGSRQTLVPIDGEAVELEGGIRAVAHDVDGVLSLRLETLDGFQADYRYLADPAAPGTLRVQVIARNPGDGAAYEVERSYRQGPAP